MMGRHTHTHTHTHTLLHTQPRTEPSSVQAAHLRDLNRRGDAEAVIRLYESGALQSTEAATGEYIKALVNVERLDSSRLMGTIQVNCCLSGSAAG